MTIISFIFANLKFRVAYNYHLCLSVSSLVFFLFGCVNGLSESFEFRFYNVIDLDTRNGGRGPGDQST